jgi:hypothetical protein
MKSNFFKSFLALAAMSFGLFSCDEPVPPVVEDPTATFEVKVNSVSQTTAEIGIEATLIDEIAYVVEEQQSDDLLPAVVFAIGKDVDPAATTVTLKDLDANKTYWVYFAAKTQGDFFEDKVFELEVSTMDYTFDKMLTLVDTELMGFKVRVTVPDEVRNEPEKYAVRYNFGSLLDVLMAKYEMGRTWAVSLMENGHGCMGWQETVRDTTVYIHPYNENRLNEDGSTYIDPETGEPIMLHLPVAPAEPYLFTAGQYRYGHLDETGWGWSYGSEEKDWGYYVPMWDQNGWVNETGGFTQKSLLEFDPVTGVLNTGEEKYWADNSFGKNGAFQALYFQTKAPELLETDFEIVIEDVTPVDASVSFLVDDNVFVYSYMICSDATYRTLVNDLLLGHEEWLQWLVCSYYGMQHLYFPTLQGNATVSARDFNSVALESDNLYHVFVTVIGDENGSKQKFVHKTFETTPKVMGAPVIEVTPVENNENEYFAKFNVKAPNKDVVRAYYAADYKREFLFEANTDVKYADLCQNMFFEEEIEKINSDEGLEVQINATDGQIVRMAVLGYNAEETANDLYSPEKAGKPCPAVADCQTKLLDMVPQVNSPLFNTLEGQWTATAQLLIREYDKNNNIQEYKLKKTANIEIVNQIPTPALTQDVYDFYSGYGYDKAATDALYDDYKREAEIFNNYRLKYRNRVLCLGWFDEDPIYPNESRLALATPFDLFVHTQYSCIDNAQIFYDFGPKWYLEIDADGNVTLPFDMWATPPMSFWQRIPFFMAAYNPEQNHGYKSAVVSSREDAEGEVIMPAEFPVEIVNDDKFIIKPVMAPLFDEAGAKLYAHYPNAIGGWGEHDAQMLRPVVSEITFTRGWKSTASTSASAARQAECAKPRVAGETWTPAVVKSLTPVKNVNVPTFEQKEMYILTEDMLNASIESYLDKKYNR